MTPHPKRTHTTPRVRRSCVAWLAMSLGVAGAPAHGATTGFAVHDLTRIEANARELGGKRFDTRGSADRLTLACADCDDTVAIDVLLGKSTDGTEGRYRSGQTGLAQLEAICKARDDACRLEPLAIGGAVGWLSLYSRGSTAILFRDGDMLTIRAIAGTPQAARQHVRAALETLAPRIVGR